MQPTDTGLAFMSRPEFSLHFLNWVGEQICLYGLSREQIESAVRFDVACWMCATTKRGKVYPYHPDGPDEVPAFIEQQNGKVEKIAADLVNGAIDSFKKGMGE